MQLRLSGRLKLTGDAALDGDGDGRQFNGVDGHEEVS